TKSVGLRARRGVAICAAAPFLKRARESTHHCGRQPLNPRTYFGGFMSWLRALLVLAFFASAASAGDWPQWLGPNRDNSTTEVISPWKEPPRVLWRRPAGEGNSSPVVAAGRVLILAKVKDKNEEELTAYDAESGKLLWQKAYPRS